MLLYFCISAFKLIWLLYRSVCMLLYKMTLKWSLVIVFVHPSRALIS